MAAVATIALSDALATPVVHNFIPIGQDKNGTWWFEDQSPASAIGYNRISVSLTRSALGASGQASAANRVNRCKLGIYLPVLETLGTNDAGVTPPPTVAFVNRCNIEYSMPERNSLQNRKDLVKYSANLPLNALVNSAVQDLQPLY